MAYDSLAALLQAHEATDQPLAELIAASEIDETGIDRKAFDDRMRTLWRGMLAVSEGYSASARSPSGLSGGDAGLVEGYAHKFAGEYFSEVIAEALRQAESNACMRVIVAAPTAGACGVLPAVLIPSYHRGKSETELIAALTVAAGVGQVIAKRASISGAEGGCQAEIGSASAMAAAALATLEGGDPQAAVHAAAMALSNFLGLVCDPVAGLVEVPCVNRNVAGAVNAVACAQMAVAGVKSRVPADEVIDAMRKIGSMLPGALRETGEGGLAATPAGQAIRAALYDNYTDGHKEDR